MSTAIHSRSYRSHHPEKVRAYKQWYYLDHKKRDADRERRAQLRYRFGITPEQYDQLLADQRGVCAVCHRSDPTGRRLAVDHDHQTGVVRGLLCSNCNRAIGQLAESPDVLAAALAYLRQ